MSRIASLELLRPDFGDRVARLIGELLAARIPLEVFETVRSPERQTELYARGRDPAKADFGRTVTRAKAYFSAHQYGLAVDFVFKVDGNWTWDEPLKGMWNVLGELAHQVGLETLSFEKPHVQMAPFVLHNLQQGPMDTGAWLAWLARTNGVGAVPVVET